MPRAGELSNNEKEFILAALEKDIRIDGRAFDEHRSLAITFGDNYGSVDVSLGNTRYGSLKCSILDVYKVIESLLVSPVRLRYLTRIANSKVSSPSAANSRP